MRTPEQKRNYTQQLFSAIAPEYDFICRVLSFRRDAAWKRALVAALPPRHGIVCLDLACGTGDLTFLLADRYPGACIVGLDFAESMLALARRRNERSNVCFVRQDMGALGFGAESVDIITGGYALRNAPDLGVAVREIRRVLKPGGVAAFLDLSRPSRRVPDIVQRGLLRIWGDFWGWLLHRNPDAYGYLAKSLGQFPDRVRLRGLFRENGFEIVASRRHFLGLMEMLMVRKLAPSDRAGHLREALQRPGEDGGHQTEGQQ